MPRRRRAGPAPAGDNLIREGIMTTATSPRQPELTWQTVIVIDCSPGIGPETAGRTAAEDAGVILIGSLEQAAAGLPEQVGHVMIAAAGPAFC